MSPMILFFSVIILSSSLSGLPMPYDGIGTVTKFDFSYHSPENYFLKANVAQVSIVLCPSHTFTQ